MTINVLMCAHYRYMCWMCRDVLDVLDVPD